MIRSELTTGKRRTFARSITALLAILMICGVLCACSNPSGGTDSTTAPVASTTAPEADTTDSIYANLPTGNYDKAEIHILNNISSWALTTMESSEQLGDTISDAITERNSMLEEQVGVTLVIDTVSNVLSAVRKDQDTDTHMYDFFVDASSSNVKLVA